MYMHLRPAPCLRPCASTIIPPPRLPRHITLPPYSRSRRLVGHTGHGAGRVVLASGPQGTADLRGVAERHAETRGAEEGVGGAVVLAEIEIHVGPWATRAVLVSFVGCGEGGG